MNNRILIISLSLINCFAISYNVYKDAPNFDAMGYNNCSMYENGELDVIQQLVNKGDMVIDVGANLGEWTKNVLALGVSKIYAFEPLPDIFRVFKTKIVDPKVIIFNCALGDQSGSMNFVYYKQLSGVLSGFYRRDIVENKIGFEANIIEVEVETLDRFCRYLGIDHINYLKIDTEGAELLVLRGASYILQEKMVDYVQFEYGGCYPDAGITLKQVFDLLRSYDYHIFRIVSGGLVHIEEWRNALENSQYSNYLAVSSDKLDRVLS